MPKTYPDFKERVGSLELTVKPSDGSDSPEEYRRIFRLFSILLIKRGASKSTSFYLRNDIAI